MKKIEREIMDLGRTCPLNDQDMIKLLTRICHVMRNSAIARGDFYISSQFDDIDGNVSAMMRMNYDQTNMEKI